MKEKLLIWVVSLLFPCLGIMAENMWTAETLPMAHIVDSRRWTCNPDGVLSQSVVDSIDAVINMLNAEKGIEGVPVVVKRVEGDDCFSFGMGLSRKYHIGNKQANTGFIIILSTEDRAYQILIGKGLEGTLPDAVCSRIKQKVLVPLLKEGNWDMAILETVKAMAAYINGDDSIMADEEESSDEIIGIFVGIFSAIFLLFCVFIIAGGYNKQCPMCGKKKLRMVKRKFLYQKDRRDYYQVTYKCKNCKHTETRIESKPHERGGNGGVFIGGTPFGSGHFGGGGGFHGGSFGGGSFGGGGVGGRF